MNYQVIIQEDKILVVPEYPFMFTLAEKDQPWIRRFQISTANYWLDTWVKELSETELRHALGIFA